MRPILGFIALLWLMGITAAALPLEREHHELYNDWGKDCPPGYHATMDFEASETNVTCSPCKEGTDYTAHPNRLSLCLPCAQCKPDQEVVSICSRMRNTECRCRKGTYCPPDHPCEVCLRCTPSCPEGEYLVNPCNATDDIQCASQTDNKPSENALGTRGIVAIVIVLVLVALILGIFLWKKCGEDEHSDSRSLLWYSQVCFNTLRECCLRRSEGKDNVRNKITETRERRLLLAETGDEPVDLHRAFYSFIDYVPLKQWRMFLRNLQVSDNEILVAEQNYPHDVKEQQFQVLNSWLNRAGAEASVNSLLAALCRIGLRGVAEKIAEELIKTPQFKYDA